MKANSVDPEQTAPIGAADHGPYFCHRGFLTVGTRSEGI